MIERDVHDSPYCTIRNKGLLQWRCKQVRNIATKNLTSFGAAESHWWNSFDGIKSHQCDGLRRYRSGAHNISGTSRVDCKLFHGGGAFQRHARCCRGYIRLPC
eukprot:86501-Prorocentrum_minimum.AAC.1